MDRRFLSAYINPGQFRFLGRTLYPWCLKYRVRLTAFDSPLVTGSQGVSPADLIFASQVCAEETLGELTWRDKLRILKLNRSPVEFERQLKLFAGYVMVEHWPKFWEKDEKKSGGSKGVPWPLAIVSNLIANGIPEKRAWEMPECQAIWLNTAFAITKGADVSIMSPEEEAYMAEEEAREASASNPAKVDPTDDNGTIP
jgi:hypothetical protein